MTEKEKMLAGKIYDSSDKELAELRTKAHKLSQQYSSLYEDDERRKAILDELLTSFFPTMARDFFSKVLCILTMAFSQSSAQAAMQTSI